MKMLNEILAAITPIEIIGASDITVNSIQIDSRKVSQGDCFVAIKGSKVDAHQFMSSVIAAGATTIVCSDLPKEINDSVVYVLVEDASDALGKISAAYYENPSHSLKLVGVTGTNGKTSVATLLYRLYRKLNFNVGLLSTVENKMNDETFVATHTTPDAIQLNQLLRKFVDSGCEYCFIEVSSHAVDQKRISGLKFEGAIFTNITHDHLDYHITFENYLKAKKAFFDNLPKSAFAITNSDDRNGMVMLQNCAAKKYSYSLKTNSDFKCKVIENSIFGLHLLIDGIEVHTSLIGEFNAYNITAVYAACNLLGVEKMKALELISELQPPSGRFQQILSKQEKILGIIDYAHTPDALKNVIHTIRSFKSDNQQLITVIGCGGDRDKSKRPLMGQVASKFSDKCILTSDNPRSENPADIIDEMYKGVEIVDRKKVLINTDRKEATKMAVSLSGSNDIILLAGKGHEKYQEINGVKQTYDDVAVLAELFNELEK
jgi:UDP-N-acetylmuramoyl-L-alanyl-D-glutamate--2,6-diaminopimelate ligase